ncbi:hypothetical protein TNCV_1008522 [Trichonephila clavipes]|nr:hypothetical protein TNCV_1008522 [Trichonephila clavipes]
MLPIECPAEDNVRDPTACLVENFLDAETIQRTELPAGSTKILSSMLATHSDDAFKEIIAIAYCTGPGNCTT